MVVFRGDPCGVICILITYAAVFYADYVVVRHLVIPTLSYTLWGAVNTIGFNVIVFLLILAHLRAVLSDPGLVPRSDAELEFTDIHNNKVIKKENGDWTVCMKCEAYRPPRAHHCRICRRCVRRMDHHCPWINNCVGEFNQKYFLQFLIYVGFASIYSITLVIVSWLIDSKAHSEAEHYRLVHSLCLVIESILFGLFVIAIGCDQMQAILTDETAVEQVKNKYGEKRLKRRPTKELLEQVFGEGPVYTWFCPLFSTTFPAANLETVPLTV